MGVHRMTLTADERGDTEAVIRKRSIGAAGTLLADVG